MFAIISLDAATWKGNSSTDAGKVFDDVTFGLWEILDSVKISLLQPQSNGEETLILKDQGESSSDLSFLEVRHRAFGKCYTLHPEEWIRQLGINIMEIKT